MKKRHRSRRMRWLRRRRIGTGGGVGRWCVASFSFLSLFFRPQRLRPFVHLSLTNCGSSSYLCALLKQEGCQGKPYKIDVASTRASSSPASLQTLPLELVDLILSYLTRTERCTLSRTSLHFLRVICGPLYNTAVFDEEKVAIFMAARVS